MRVYQNSNSAVNAVRSGKVVAFLTDAATLQYFAQVYNCAWALLQLEHRNRFSDLVGFITLMLFI